MYQTIMVVLAILLAGLLAVGGINYINQDTALRIEVSKTLEAHADLLVGTVSIYKSTNNGFFPNSIKRINTLLPDGNIPALPKSMSDFSWTTVKTGGTRGICISGYNSEGLDSDVAAGVTTFAKMRALDLPGSVLYSDACGQVGFSTSEPDLMEPENLTNTTSMAVVIKDQ
ncbi:hypothetical protein [Roseibium sp. RKSG952]|uniref:hypothetical protein n=1 Tax=Roseibium sp. RKSG952 TaxID=2529384 RepID=UPI0012BD1B94|nr:hypothetical protein [Roseibium sp. RKSG952]MTH94892.1 hypothetical protein [Roseibium sp. RKSG952]